MGWKALIPLVATALMGAAAQAQTQVGGRVQVLLSPDAEEPLRLRRFKPFVQHQFGPRGFARLQLEGGDWDWRLDEGYVQVKPEEHLGMRLGVFKPVLARQFMTSSRELLFPDRSLAVRTFASNAIDSGDGPRTGYGAGRPPGLELFGTFDKGKTYLARHSDGQQELEIARLEVHTRGDPGFSEGALAATSSPRFALDAGTARDSGAFPRELLSLGGSLKWRRFSAQVEWFEQSAQSVFGHGSYWMASWLAMPRRLEVGLRSGSVDLGTGVPADHEFEDSLGVSWYFEGHRRKVQLELFERHDRDGMNLQYQITF